MTPCRSCHPAASNQPTISQLARQLRLYSCKQQPPSTLLAMPQRLQTPMPRQAGCCSSPAYATQLLTEAAGTSHMPPVNASVPMQAVLACHTITLRQQVGNLFLCCVHCSLPALSPMITYCSALLNESPAFWGSGGILSCTLPGASFFSNILSPRFS